MRTRFGSPALTRWPSSSSTRSMDSDGSKDRRNSNWLKAPSSSRPLDVTWRATWARISVGMSSGVVFLLGGGKAALEDLETHLVVGRLDLDGDAALQPGADPRIERLQLPGCTVRRNDHLTGRIQQHVEKMAELVLYRLALQELHVIDDEQVDIAKRFLKGQRIVVADRGGEAPHEIFRP